MAEISKWHVEGDWFDVCKCNIPCPCTFAQSPSYGDCEGVLAYHIIKGNYNQVSLAGLNLLALGSFEGNIGVAKPRRRWAYSLMNEPTKNSVKHFR